MGDKKMSDKQRIRLLVEKLNAFQERNIWLGLLVCGLGGFVLAVYLQGLPASWNALCVHCINALFAGLIGVVLGVGIGAFSAPHISLYELDL